MRALKLDIFRVLICVNFLEARSQQNWRKCKKKKKNLNFALNEVLQNYERILEMYDWYGLNL